MAADPPIRIDLETVASSNLAAIGYDPKRQILAVQFNQSGSIYHYAGITAEMAFDLYAAESKGTFYATTIKGKFQAERMTGPCPKCGDEGWIGDTCTDCGTGPYTAVPYTQKEKKAHEPPRQTGGTGARDRGPARSDRGWHG